MKNTLIRIFCIVAAILAVGRHVTFAEGVTPPHETHVTKFTFLKQSNVALFANVTTDPQFVYVEVLEVWRGNGIQLGDILKIPQSKTSALRKTQPDSKWLCVVSFSDYPNFDKSWAVQGSDDVLIGGMAHPTVQEMRDYFKAHPNQPPQPTLGRSAAERG